SMSHPKNFARPVRAAVSARPYLVATACSVVNASSFRLNTTLAASLAAAFAAGGVHAQSAHQELAPVVVTANPLGSSLFDMVTPVTVVNRRNLSDGSATSLGEALSDVPGI